MVWIDDFLHFKVHSFFNSATGAKMNRHAEKNLEICKSFANLFFRQVWHDIISVKKVRQTRKTLEISHFEENGDVHSLNGTQVLTVCDMNRVPLSNLHL